MCRSVVGCQANILRKLEVNESCANRVSFTDQLSSSTTLIHSLTEPLVHISRKHNTTSVPLLLRTMTSSTRNSLRFVSPVSFRRHSTDVRANPESSAAWSHPMHVDPKHISQLLSVPLARRHPDRRFTLAPHDPNLPSRIQLSPSSRFRRRYLDRRETLDPPHAPPRAARMWGVALRYGRRSRRDEGTLQGGRFPRLVDGRIATRLEQESRDVSSDRAQERREGKVGSEVAQVEARSENRRRHPPWLAKADNEGPERSQPSVDTYSLAVEQCRVEGVPVQRGR